MVACSKTNGDHTIVAPVAFAAQGIESGELPEILI